MTDNRLQVIGYRLRPILVGFLFSLFAITYSLFPKGVIAQAISLSISPPLLELTIQPGKVVKQAYTITNNNSNETLKAKIVYFVPSDLDGNIEITDTPAPDWVRFDQKTSSLIISPPENIAETDHFLTLVFETEKPLDLLSENSTSYVSQIGSNILISVSKDGNPKKSAEIVEFSAPRVVDSLSPITYSLTLANVGNSFWKPIGKIIVDDKETLKLTPQNILSGYSRKIGCIKDDNLVECNLQSRFYIGKIRSKLEFTLDDDPKVYKQEVTTYAFPFTLLLAFVFLGIIFRIWQRKK